MHKNAMKKKICRELEKVACLWNICLGEHFLVDFHAMQYSARLKASQQKIGGELEKVAWGILIDGQTSRTSEMNL